MTCRHILEKFVILRDKIELANLVRLFHVFPRVLITALQEERVAVDADTSIHQKVSRSEKALVALRVLIFVAYQESSFHYAGVPLRDFVDLYGIVV